MMTVSDILRYLQRMELTGLGHCKVGLCRRGLELRDVLNLVIPCDGERVSEDGSTVYLSARRIEE